MKSKNILTAIMLTAALAAGAATPQLSEPVRIDMPHAAYSPVLSPDGSTMLYATSSDHRGLNAMYLATGRTSTVSTENASSFAPVFSADSRTVYYRTATLNDGLMCHQWNAHSLTSARSSRLGAPSRRDIAVADIATAPVAPYANADWKTIEIVNGSSHTSITPIEDAHSYLWASLSPNGKKVLFCEPFKGVFVCNIDGTDPVKVIAKGDYPVWLTDNVVLAIVSHDDGYFVSDAILYAIDITTGKKVQVSADDVLVGEVTACPATRTAVFATMDGDLYKFNIK